MRNIWHGRAKPSNQPQGDGGEAIPPIFLHVAIAIDAVHFGVIMVANLWIGLCTPPRAMRSSGILLELPDLSEQFGTGSVLDAQGLQKPVSSDSFLERSHRSRSFSWAEGRGVSAPAFFGWTNQTTIHQPTTSRSLMVSAKRFSKEGDLAITRGLVLVGIGLCTPLAGTCLFFGRDVGGAKITGVSRAMIPFYSAMFLALIVITYWPELSLWLPRLPGEMD